MYNVVVGYCVSSFLEKRGCNHAQLIIQSRQRMN